MAIYLLVIVLAVLALLFGVSSIMQSYASARQAEAVIETAQAAQMATFANAVVIVVMALILLAILAGVVYLMMKPTTERRQNRLEAGRKYGEQLRQLRARREARLSHLEEPATDESLLMLADQDQVDEFIDELDEVFEDWRL